SSSFLSAYDNFISPSIHLMNLKSSSVIRSFDSVHLSIANHSSALGSRSSERKRMKFASILICLKWALHIFVLRGTLRSAANSSGGTTQPCRSITTQPCRSEHSTCHNFFYCMFPCLL
ncbi:hypothetical protein PENTCL1PPCAC_19089, partial [Pristionchus entomophagus]